MIVVAMRILDQDRVVLPIKSLLLWTVPCSRAIATEVYSIDSRSLNPIRKLSVVLISQ